MCVCAAACLLCRMSTRLAPLHLFLQVFIIPVLLVTGTHLGLFHSPSVQPKNLQTRSGCAKLTQITLETIVPFTNDEPHWDLIQMFPAPPIFLCGGGGGSGSGEGRNKFTLHSSILQCLCSFLSPSPAPPPMPVGGRGAGFLGWRQARAVCHLARQYSCHLGQCKWM